MFKGTSENNTGYQPYTGLAAFKVLAVNPTKQEIETITGRTYPFEVNYDLREDINGNKVRPIEFWVFNEENNITDKVTFQIGNKFDESQSGNLRFINQKGQSRYAKTLEEANEKYEKLAPFVRQLYLGEDSLYVFMQRAMGYKPSDENAQFLTDCENNEITQNNLYNGNVKSLRDFIEFINSKKRRIGLVLGVKEKEKTNDDGNKTISYRQVILNNSDYFFTLATGGITDWNQDRLKEIIEEKEKRNVSLGTALFTINFVKFDKTKCVNYVPDTPKPAPNSNWK